MSDTASVVRRALDLPLHPERIVIERDVEGRFVARSSGFLFSKDGAPGTLPVEASDKLDRLTEKLTDYLNGLAAPAVTP